MTSVLPLDLIATFDSLLRDDPSDANLLIWADALEDAGDEACRGVREFLVGQKRRPRRIIGAVSWWDYEVNENDGSDIGDVMQRLAFSSDDYDNACYYRMYLLGPHYYTIALYDAAQAWCEMNPPENPANEATAARCACADSLSRAARRSVAKIRNWS